MIKKIKMNKELLLIALPGTILLIVLKYLPIPGMLLAFKDFKFQPGNGFYENLFTSEWSGLENFEFLYRNDNIYAIIRNTLGYNIINIILGLIFAVIVAIILKEIHSKKTRNTAQTLIFFPYFMSWVAISYMVLGFLDSENGILNKIIEYFGGEAINWYQDPTYWPIILIFLGVWKSLGYNSVMYLSALTSVDDSLYEAAMIDGASKWKQIKNITIPSLQPLMITLTILAIGGIMFSDFGLFYQIPKNSGALYPVTMTLDVFVYNTLKVTGDVSLSAAAGVFQSIVGLFMILIANFIIRKVDAEKALF